MNNFLKKTIIVIVVIIGAYFVFSFVIFPTVLYFSFTKQSPSEAIKTQVEIANTDTHSIEYKNKEQDATIRADFTKQMGLFEIYYSNTGSYDGYCNSITNNSYTCKTFGDKGGYLMYTKLNNNKYFCIDNGYEFKELEKEPFGKTCAE